MTEQDKNEGVSLKAKLIVLLIAVCLLIAGGLIVKMIDENNPQPEVITVEKKVYVPANESSGPIDPSNATEQAIKALGGEGKVEILKQEENVTTHRKVVTQVLLKDNGTSRLKPEEREVTKGNVTYRLGDKIVEMSTSQIIELVAEENTSERRVS